MFSLAINDIREMPDADEEGWLISEPRWLTRDTPTRVGDLVLEVEQHTADLINYYMVTHTSGENFVADQSCLVGMILTGEEEHLCHLFKINERGDQQEVDELDLRNLLVAEITGPRTRTDVEIARHDDVIFYDPPEIESEEEENE